MPLLDIIAFVVFILIIVSVAWYDRKNIKRSGIVLIRHTKHGRTWLDNTVKKHKRIWSITATLAVIAWIPAMCYITYFLVDNAIKIIMRTGGAAVNIVLPGPDFSAAPGVFMVPWYFWVIAVAILAIPHELAHGAACRLLKIKVKSLGWFLLAILPGAFVEPDENQLKRAPRFSKMKVYAIGSFVNFVTAAIFGLAAFGILSAVFVSSGITPSGLAIGSPAAEANISGTILEIGGTPMTSFDIFQEKIKSLPIGSPVEIKTTKGTYTVKTIKHPEFDRAYIGVTGPYSVYLKARPGLEFLESSFMVLLDRFQWIFIFTLGVGLVNLLPAKPFDGGKLFEELISIVTGRKRSVLVANIASIVLVLILIFSIIGPMVLAQL